MIPDVLELLDVPQGVARDLPPTTAATPLGDLLGWVEVDGRPLTLAPPTAAWQIGAAAAALWSTPAARIELVFATPVYPDATFDVAGLSTWLWRVRLDGSCDEVGFRTVFREHSALLSEPVASDWMFGTSWSDAGTFQALGTSNPEALAIRTGAGEWLPERYLEDLDPSRPGTAPFLDRGPAGLRATFTSPRPGERFEHHATIAWADASRRAGVLDAVDVEATGVLRGSRADTPAG